MMVTPLRISNLLVLAALVCTGTAVKCYLGSTSTTHDCKGSCTKTTMVDNEDWIVPACWPTVKEEGCTQMTQGVRVEMCYCNTDYCNTSPPTSLPSLLLLLLAPLLFSFLNHVY